MSSNNNFLLKIHMEEEGNIKEIFLNKERRSFTFLNDECVSDLIIPEFKVTSLNMILKNINDSNGSDTYYAEYEKDEELIREYDKEKINVLVNMVTNISINDFFDQQKDIKINDYYVDNVIDAYNCVLPIDVKKLISYTTNGVVFSGDDNIYMLPHDDIVNYKGDIKDFIPIMMKNDTNYIGYDYKESVYKEYLNGKKINESKTLKGLVVISQIEILDLDEEEKEENFVVELIDKTEDEINKEYEETLKNIDYQLERLNNGLIQKDKKEEQYVEKKKPQKEVKPEIKNKIKESIRKSIEEIEKTNSLIDEIDSNVEKVTIKKNNIKNKKDKQKEKQKNQKQKEVIKTPKIKEIKTVEEKPEPRNEKLAAFLKEYDKQQIENLKALKEFHEKEAKAKQEEVTRKALEAKKKAEEEKLVMQNLNKLLINSINNGLNNYKINFNDTQKLVVEHLPYYEFTNNFDVIQIPEIEVDKITLLPSGELDFGKIKLVVNNLGSNKVDLLVQNASSIIDKDNNKIKAGMHLELDLKNEISLRLNKKGVMETWTFRMEKSTFIKELRNIDYRKVMNYIINLEGYKKLGNIEKYELQKSVMLFIDFVMRYDEEKELEELYRILTQEPTLYEEYITKYNIKHSLELKDKLCTYDYKKEYVTKLNYVNGLIDAKWLDYPRYIFRTHNYFLQDEFLQEFIDELNNNIKEEDFANYLKKIFKEYDMFTKLDEDGLDNLNKCLEYLSVLYKHNPSLGEKYKYQIEKTFMIGATEEDIALLISKLCRRGIRDYSLFIEYDVMMKNKYRLGELKYPIFSESFGIEEIRNGGEYDEY